VVLRKRLIVEDGIEVRDGLRVHCQRVRGGRRVA
jgi:hypothetical protein